jgi:hypothetical protein
MWKGKERFEWRAGTGQGRRLISQQQPILEIGPKSVCGLEPLSHHYQTAPPEWAAGLSNVLCASHIVFACVDLEALRDKAFHYGMLQNRKTVLMPITSASGMEEAGFAGLAIFPPGWMIYCRFG